MENTGCEKLPCTQNMILGKVKIVIFDSFFMKFLTYLKNYHLTLDFRFNAFGFDRFLKFLTYLKNYHLTLDSG